MKKTRKKQSREEIISEWLNLYPVGYLEYEIDDRDLVTVLVPHPENWFTRTFLPRTNKPARRIHLDDVGSFVWQQCDGSRSVREIAAALGEKFGDKVAPVEERTVMFLQQMYREEFVKMYEKKSDVGTQSDAPQP